MYETEGQAGTPEQHPLTSLTPLAPAAPAVPATAPPAGMTTVVAGPPHHAAATPAPIAPAHALPPSTDPPGRETVSNGHAGSGSEPAWYQDADTVENEVVETQPPDAEVTG